MLAAEAPLEYPPMGRGRVALSARRRSARYPPIREKMSRKGAPPQAEVTKSL
jgi:hypothetical protein